MKKNIVALSVCLFTLIMSGCATYHLTPQSLVDQASQSVQENKTLVFVALPLFYAGTVTGNNLKSIKCLDESGQVKIIKITQHTGIRITRKNGTKKTFYFDTLILKDSTITGSVTHFANVQIKPIILRDVAKIEIQK